MKISDWGKKAGILLILAVVALAFLVPAPASAAEYWRQIDKRIGGTAGEAIAIGDAVMVAASDGYVYKADSNDGDKRPAIGVSGTAAADGEGVAIVIRGSLSGQTAASPGYRLFLSETAGALTTTAPTANPQPMGWILPGDTAGAASSTNYLIDPMIAATVGY